MHPQFTTSWVVRFWSRIDRSGDCWLWTGARHPEGYGHVRLPGGGPPVNVHRVAWMLAYGHIPDGQIIRHTCDNPPCCNPSHLLLGTDADNASDKMHRGRFVPLPGERNGQAKITAEQVREIRALYAAFPPNRPNGKRYGISVVLAKQFGITGGHIAAIINRHAWAHIE